MLLRVSIVLDVEPTPKSDDDCLRLMPIKPTAKSHGPRLESNVMSFYLKSMITLLVTNIGISPPPLKLESFNRLLSPLHSMDPPPPRHVGHEPGPQILEIGTISGEEGS